MPVLRRGSEMTDLDQVIVEAWERIRPRVKGDREELERRLRRRRMAVLQRPMRAWCIALRASDRRITPAHWIIYPEHAMELMHEEHPYERIEHEVTIDARVLRKYCRAVRTDSWGEEVEEVAEKLGVGPEGLRAARREGNYLTERRIQGLGGKRGKPVPLIHCWKSLDPGSASLFRRPDQIWGCMWEFLPDSVPDDFRQEVM